MSIGFDMFSHLLVYRTCSTPECSRVTASVPHTRQHSSCGAPFRLLPHSCAISMGTLTVVITYPGAS